MDTKFPIKLCFSLIVDGVAQPEEVVLESTSEMFALIRTLRQEYTELSNPALTVQSPSEEFENVYAISREQEETTGDIEIYSLYITASPIILKWLYTTAGLVR